MNTSVCPGRRHGHQLGPRGCYERSWLLASSLQLVMLTFLMVGMMVMPSCGVRANLRPAGLDHRPSLPEDLGLISKSQSIEEPSAQNIEPSAQDTEEPSAQDTEEPSAQDTEAPSAGEDDKSVENPSSWQKRRYQSPRLPLRDSYSDGPLVPTIP